MQDRTTKNMCKVLKDEEENKEDKLIEQLIKLIKKELSKKK